MKKLIAYTIISFFCSCNLFKNTQKDKSVIRETIDSTSYNLKNTIHNNETLKWEIKSKKDSLEIAGILEIIPIGEFTFSPISGFSGNASSLRWTVVASASNYGDSETVQQQKTTLEDSELQYVNLEKKKTEKIIKKKAEVSKVWILFIIASVLIGGYLLYRKR